jgi:hypothetical protein
LACLTSTGLRHQPRRPQLLIPLRRLILSADNELSIESGWEHLLKVRCLLHLTVHELDGRLPPHFLVARPILCIDVGHGRY